MDDTTQEIITRKPGRPRKADAPEKVEQAPAKEPIAPKGPHRAVLTTEGWVLPESYAQGVK